MNDKVYINTLPAAALQVAVEALRPHAAYGIVENLTEIDFPPPQAEAIDISRWRKGRIFSPDFELRWERFEEGYRTILVTTNEQPPLPELSDSGLKLPSPEKIEYYCWRENDSRLGRTLDYRCVPGRGEVKLFVHEYRDDHGRLIFWRYVDMKRQDDTHEPV